MTTQNLQALFFSGNGKDGSYLYYVREPVQSEEQATSMAQQLARREGFNVKVTIEDWNNSKYKSSLGPFAP